MSLYTTQQTKTPSGPKNPVLHVAVHLLLGHRGLNNERLLSLRCSSAITAPKSPRPSAAGGGGRGLDATPTLSRATPRHYFSYLASAARACMPKHLSLSCVRANKSPVCVRSGALDTLESLIRFRERAYVPIGYASNV